MGLLARVVIIGPPVHSDDYYRFFWDGQLIVHQINPYKYTPSELIQNGKVPNMLQPFYAHLNSQTYYSVYPLTNQLWFGTAAWVAGGDIMKFIISLRTILIIFEMWGIWLLYSILSYFQKNPIHSLLYVLNPLILIEVSGNLHFEGMMVTFMLLGIWTLVHRRYHQAGGWIGAAISVKLTPLILMPLLFKYLSQKNLLRFIIGLALICIVTFIPIILTGSFGNFHSSIQLYYGTFEFNASLYYIIREVGYFIKGYNMIAGISIWLSVMVCIGICYMATKLNSGNFQQLISLSIIAYLVYLMFSMVVHPWYIIPLIGLGIIGGKVFPLIWSYLIYLSYYTYSTVPYQENYMLLIIQYGILAVIILYEFTPHLLSDKKDFLKL
ncbi:glycosyltransferase 87 family protein [Anditalea andensis]|nr:glycosyltransferase 87 family protein [Anditalea andensis]